MQAIFSTAYLPPVQYYSALLKHDALHLELYEHYPKQTYRNRCYIYSPNGTQLLTIPLIHAGERTQTKDIKISYSDQWQMQHWRSFEAAYKRSPYFEFYEDILRPFYETKKNNFLIDFNRELFEAVNKLMKLNFSFTPTTEYFKSYSDITDLRDSISPKTREGQSEFKKYTQVFENKHGFISNLSIIDLLFNHGPKSGEYL